MERQWKSQAQGEWGSDQQSVYTSPEDDDYCITALLIGIPRHSVLEFPSCTIHDLASANDEGPSSIKKLRKQLHWNLHSVILAWFPGTTSGPRLYTIVGSLKFTVNKANGERTCLGTSSGNLIFLGLMFGLKLILVSSTITRQNGMEPTLTMSIYFLLDRTVAWKSPELSAKTEIAWKH